MNPVFSCPRIKAVTLALSPAFRWKLLPQTPAERDRLSSALKLRPLTAQILSNRGLTDVQQATDAAQPSLRHIADPTSIPGFADASAALMRALKQGTHVLIHGDYDCDGLCGSAILHHLFQSVGIASTTYVPDRERDGYSFGPRSLEAARACGAGLIIAVDNGTTAYEWLDKLAEEGFEVVIVDHHPPGDQEANCAALMNPLLADAESGAFHGYCGAGVAWLLTWGFLRDLHGSDGQLPENQRRLLMDTLTLAAVATIGDAMKLVGPNRGLIRKGLAHLSSCTLPGVKALAEMCKMPDPPTARDIGFRFAPALNAPGRLGRAQVTADLLACTDLTEARQLAATAQALNDERKNLQNRQARQLEADSENQRENGAAALVIGSADVQFGILGPVASRIVDHSGLPVFAWAETEPGLARGSSRAPDGYNLYPLFQAADDAGLLKGWGGHKQASGFHFDPIHAEALEKCIHEAAALQPKPPLPELVIDCEVAPFEIDVAQIAEITSLEPWGRGFQPPLFMASGLKLLRGPRVMGADETHLSFELERDGNTVRCVAWNRAASWGGLQAGDQVDVVFRAEINAFRGRKNVQWTLEDLRTSTGI
jgi:single-stranded-DNA-specific exonuclease